MFSTGGGRRIYENINKKKTIAQHFIIFSVLVFQVGGLKYLSPKNNICFSSPASAIPM